MPEMHFLQDLLVLFGLGIVAVVAFHRLNLPPVLGFLITGVICGPYGFKLVDDVHGVETLAEIGLVLLLFTIGIEFSVKTFLRLKKFLLIAGGLQVLGTIGVGAALTHWIGMTWPAAVFIGMLLSMSSTAIVIRILEHRGDLESAHGRSALSILIFQDLCIVPMVLLAPFLGGKGGNLWEVALLSGKAALFLLLAATVARYLVPWLLNQVARTKKREAFVLSIILLCLGTATATSHFGLSMALGAFIAGLIISESKYSHQALGEVLPFREVFNCLVFVSIGMLFDVRILLASPVLVLAALLVVILGKALVGAVATGLLGHSWRVALLTGFAIAQISEFSFVLAKLGLNVGVLDANTNQLFLAIAILSMFLTPAAIGTGARLASWVEKFLPAWLVFGRGGMPDHAEEKLVNHVVIVGFGLAGRKLASVLSRLKIAYEVIDQDPETVADEKAKGTPILYGDASRLEVLHHAGVDKARVIVLTVSDSETLLRSAELARRINPNLHIIARARFMDEVPKLALVGSNEVVAEEFVGAVELLTRVLRNYLVPADIVEGCVRQVEEEEHLKRVDAIHHHRDGEDLPCLMCSLSVEVRYVPEGAPVCGKNLLECNLRKETGVTVVAIQRRDEKLITNPAWQEQLQAGDLVILLGQRGQLASAAAFFSAPPPAQVESNEPPSEPKPPGEDSADGAS